MNKTLFLLLLPIVALLLSGCEDDDEIKDLRVSNNYVFLKTSQNNWDSNIQHISISSGNGGYEISSDENGRQLADAQIAENVVEFKTKGKLGTGKFILKDKQGKETEITVKVEGQYMLMQVQYYSVEVKARNTLTESVLKDEVMKDMPFALETVLELISPNEQDGLIVYENMTDAANGNEKERGMFTLDSNRPCLSLSLNDNIQSFDMLGSTTQIFYWYFGLDPDIEQKIGLRSSPPPSERLGYDLTGKYQTRYPEAEIETAKLIMHTRPYLYKFMPVN